MRLLVPILAVAAALATTGEAAAWTSDYFHSPSGNIRCRYFKSDGIMACKTLNNGRVAVVPLRGEAYVLQRLTDYTFPAGPTLGYGQYWSASGAFRCDSMTGGMKCKSLRSGHGYVVNRSGFKTF